MTYRTLRIAIDAVKNAYQESGNPDLLDAINLLASNKGYTDYREQLVESQTPNLSIAEMAQLPEIAMVIIEEGDQNGVWQREGKITRITKSEDGLIIWMR